MGPELSSFYTLNLYPLLIQLRDSCTLWATLPLNLMGQIKMLFLPKFLYFFSATALCGYLLPSHPWLARTMLCLPVCCEGLALPDYRTYYWAAILVTVRW